MKKIIRKKADMIITLGLSLSLILAVVPILAEGSPTVVNVTPTDQVVGLGGNFIVNITCTPEVPIKSYELKISFDPSFVQATGVTEGDIFSGYSTFFNSGLIDNNAGTIVDIYGLIMGIGNVTSQGILVSIGFTALQESGTSLLQLYDVGLTNESEYVPLMITNGSVQIDGVAPSITSNSPGTGTTGDFYTFNISVSDNLDLPANCIVKADWSHGALGSNTTLSHVGDEFFEATITLDENSVDDMTYVVYASDSYGNRHTTSPFVVTVSDNDPPIISNMQASPASQEVDGFVNITATVQDNIMVNQVFLNITYPDTSTMNVSITANNAGATYYYHTSYSILGTYSYFIWSNDTNDQRESSPLRSFVIEDSTEPSIEEVSLLSSNPLDTDVLFGWSNITCTLSENVGVNQVRVNITNPDGSYQNHSMISCFLNRYYYNSSTMFATHGNYSYMIWVVDSSGNGNISDSYQFSMSPNWDIDMNGHCKVFDFTLISNHYDETGDPGWIREDVDNNGHIEVLDLVCVSNHYNETWWS